jgi:hypothetical protein
VLSASNIASGISNPVTFTAQKSPFYSDTSKYFRTIGGSFAENLISSGRTSTYPLAFSVSAIKRTP